MLTMQMTVTINKVPGDFALFAAAGGAEALLSHTGCSIGLINESFFEK